MKKIAVKFDAWDPQAKGVKSVQQTDRRHARADARQPDHIQWLTRNPLPPFALSARSFLFQVSNNRLLKSNPKCIVEQILVCDKTPPTVEFTFKNDRQWRKRRRDRRATPLCSHAARRWSICTRHATLC